MTDRIADHAIESLQVSGLTVRFGANLAVDAVDFAVEPGQIVGLIGANGAGKTTTIDAICGFVEHSGQVRVGEIDVSDAPPHERALAGLARTWQSVELFSDLTIRQNCQVASQPGGIRQLVADVFRPRRRHDEAGVDAALEAVGLVDRADDLPGVLSLGHRKLAGVARALAGRPKLLLLDEPAAGLDQHESAIFGETLRSLVDDWRIGVLLVDHDTRLVFDTCTPVAVLDFGRLVTMGAPDDVRNDPRVVAAYLGSISA